MATGKCLKCDTISEMTEDHVIPQWLIKQLPNFGIKQPTKNEIELVCVKCNQTKGGKIDYSRESARTLTKLIATSLILEIRKFEQFNP